MSAEQLRADLFELGQLSRAVGLDAAKVGAHVALIRRDAEALVGDPVIGALAAEVIRTCDRLELQPDAPPPPPPRTQARPEPEPAPAPEPEPEPEPDPQPELGGIRIGLTCGDKQWVWRFPEDIERLRQEWSEGYLPVQLTPDAPSFRGILGEVNRVEALGEVDLRATLSALDCVLHLPGGDLHWQLRIDVAIVRDGEHLSTWRFPHASRKLLEEWQAGKAPLHDMPPPRAHGRVFLGEVGPPTGLERASIHLAPGHETRLVLDGTDHPLEARLESSEGLQADFIPPVRPTLSGLPDFAAGEGALTTHDAAGFDDEYLVRLSVHALSVDLLRGTHLERVEELAVGSTDPEVIALLIAGTSGGLLRDLVLWVEAPALVAHALRLVRLHLHRVSVPPLPATLRELHLTGGIDTAALPAALRSCRDLERVVLREHGLGPADLVSIQGPWLLDAGRLPGQTLGLDEELRGLRLSWEDLDPVLDRWVLQLWRDVTRLAAVHGAKLTWDRPGSAGAGAAEGPRALRRVVASGALAAWLRDVAEVLDTVDAGLNGDHGTDFGRWMRPLSAAVVQSSALARLWERGNPPPLAAGDPKERARQVAELDRLR